MLRGSDEFADQPVHLSGLFVNHPVGAGWDSMNAKVGDVLLKAIEVAGEQGAVLLAPDHESRNAHGRQGSEPALHFVGAIPIQAAGKRAGTPPGFEIGRAGGLIKGIF